MKTLDIGKVYSLRTATGFSLLFTPISTSCCTLAGCAISTTTGALDVPGRGTLTCVLIQEPDGARISSCPRLHEQHRTIEGITPFVALTEDA